MTKYVSPNRTYLNEQQLIGIKCLLNVVTIENIWFQPLSSKYRIKRGKEAHDYPASWECLWGTYDEIPL